MPHPEMLLTESEACEHALVDGICAVMITSTGNFKLFADSLLSLLLRSHKELKHVFVVLNGPRRSGNCAEQDRRHRFLEALEDAGAPITVIRIWGHVGHAHGLDMTIPWVFTRYYLLMHDDVIVINKEWSTIARQYLQRPDVVVALHPNKSGRNENVVRMCGLRTSNYPGHGEILVFPHPNTAFLVADKACMLELGSLWHGYHARFEKPTNVSELISTQQFVDYYAKHGWIDDGAPFTDITHKAVSHDVGAWLLYRSVEAHKTWEMLPDDLVVHVERGSWDQPEAVQHRVQLNSLHFMKLHDEIAYSRYGDVYRRHVEQQV